MLQIRIEYLIRIKALLPLKQKRNQKSRQKYGIWKPIHELCWSLKYFKKWNQSCLVLSFIFLSWIIDHSKYRSLCRLSFGIQHNNFSPRPCYIMRMLQDRYWICMSFIVNKSNYTSPKLLQSSKTFLVVIRSRKEYLQSFNVS